MQRDSTRPNGHTKGVVSVFKRIKKDFRIGCIVANIATRGKQQIFGRKLVDAVKVELVQVQFVNYIGLVRLGRIPQFQSVLGGSCRYKKGSWSAVISRMGN